MNSTIISIFVCSCLSIAGFLAIRLCQALPDHHVNSETKDTVKLAMGLLATMTALVLGLLVASAKSSYDTESNAVTVMSAKFVVMDRILAHYGPESMPTRMELRKSVEQMIHTFWTDPATSSDPLNPTKAPGEALYDSIQLLSPRGDTQKAMKTQALDYALEIDKARWLLLFERSVSSISIPLLVVVICWQTILFFSFGLFAPSNTITKVALVISAIAAAGAIFLILEMDSPFDGWISIPSARMEIALEHLGK